MLTARHDRFEIPEAQHQFGAFPFGGFGGFSIGSGGFAGGIRGAGFGVATGGPGGGFLAPVLTLQTIFGESFSATTVADAIKVADQQARLISRRGGEEGAGVLQNVIDIATSDLGIALVLNLASGLFEFLNAQGQKLAGGVTPEAALTALKAGGGVPPAAGGGGGQEPLPFPRRSPLSLPLPLSHLRRHRLRLLPQRIYRSFSGYLARCSGWVRIHWARLSRRFQPSRHSRRSRHPTFRPLSQLRRREYGLAAPSTSPWFSVRLEIPPGSGGRLFLTKNNSLEPSRSGNSSPNCLRFGKQDRPQTSNGEHLNSS